MWTVKISECPKFLVRMLNVDFASRDEILFPMSQFKSLLVSIPNQSDIYVAFPNIHHPLVVPTLAMMYDIQLNEYADVTFLAIPIQGSKENPSSGLIKTKLDPFPMDLYDSVAFGGTFDHLHNGHKLLITASALLCVRKLIVGVTRAPKNKMFSEYMEPFYRRAAAVTEMVYKINQNVIICMEALDDVAGPVGRQGELDLLVLSEETKSGGESVRKLREERGLHPISFVVIPVIGFNNGDKLSSTMIRSKIAKKE